MVDPTKPPPWSTTQVQCSENSNSEDLEELQWCPATGTGIRPLPRGTDWINIPVASSRVVYESGLIMVLGVS